MSDDIDGIVKQIQTTCREFCAALTQDEVERFVRYTRIKECEPREVIAEIGDVSDCFYLVIAGGVRLFQVDGENEFDVGLIEPGRLVGEMSFFDGKPRSVRLRARKSGAQLIEIHRQMFQRLRVEESYISNNLLEFVIRSLDSLVRSLSDENARLHRQVTGIGYR